MSLELDAKYSFTVFLLPFAYELQERKGEISTINGEKLTWRPLDWNKIGEPMPFDVMEYEEEERKRFFKDFPYASPDEFAKHFNEKKDEFIQDKKNERSPDWRLQYFMPETSAILYHRARWFELRDSSGILAEKIPGSDGLKCCLDYLIKEPEKRKDFISLRLHWARLILFEYPTKTKNKKDQSDSMKFARNGILALKIGFKEGTRPTISHLLLLNEAFRYYKIPYFKHPEYFKRHDVIPGLPGPHEDISKTESYWAMWVSLLSLPLHDGKEVHELMPQDWHDNARIQALSVSGNESLPKFKDLMNSPLISSSTMVPKEQSWDVYPDNRAFVWTCARLATFPENGYLPDFSAENIEANHSDPIHMKLWHALLDVDAKSDEIDAFRYKWMKERTYARWAKMGTLYGFNNFSVALMGAPQDYIPFHFESMYLDMGILLLQVRTSIFRISKKISQDTQDRLCDLKKMRKSEWVKQFRRFRGDFAAFVNLYHYPLLCTQQQGIEMYTMMRNWFDIDALFAEVKSEIESTHEHAELEADKAKEDGLATLTIYGLGIALGALIGQIFGMSDLFKDIFTKSYRVRLIAQVVLVVLFAFLGGILASRKLKRRKKK